MVLTMTRPTLRQGSTFRQFKKRVPRAVLGKAKGRAITLTLPAAEGHPEKLVQVRVGDVVKLSLHTREPSVAKARAGAVSEQLEKLWPALMAGPKRLDQKQIVALAGTLYRAFISAFENNPGGEELWARVLKDNLDALAGHDYGPITLSIASPEAKKAMAMEKRFGPFADALLAKHGLVTDADSRSRLLQQLARQLSEAARQLVRKAAGDYSPDEFVQTLPPPDAIAPKNKAAPAVGSITGLLQEWKRIVVPAKGIVPSTVHGYERAFRYFVQFLGHDEFAQLEEDSVIRFAESRLAAGIAPRTVNDGDLTPLKSVFGWSVKAKRIPHNPAAGASVEQGKKVKTRDAGFTDGEASEILKAAIHYEKSEGETPEVAAAKKWVPWLCAFTGARVGEMVQLRKQDVTMNADGFYEALITPEAGGVKGKEFRRVPLHPQLIELGFIDFVSAAPGGPLFRRDKKGKPKGRGGVANRLREFVRGIVSDPGVQPNHGWRHRFITQARKHKLNTELRRMITGHKGKSVDETDYGDAAGLYEEVCKLPHYSV